MEIFCCAVALFKIIYVRLTYFTVLWPSGLLVEAVYIYNAFNVNNKQSTSFICCFMLNDTSNLDSISFNNICSR